MNKIKYKAKRNSFLKLPNGIYRVVDGAILKQYNLVKQDYIDDGSATFVYGINDYLFIDSENNADESETSYKVISIECFVELVEPYQIDENLLIAQNKKADDLHQVLCHRSIFPLQNPQNAKLSRVYALLKWLDTYFDKQELIITHSMIASLCLSTRVTISRAMAVLREIDLVPKQKRTLRMTKPPYSKILKD